MSVRPLTMAITALGGQGGGVLANWIRELAETNGWLAQSTSVPGVAQRTGATVYYLELYPLDAASGREPVLSLSPVAGDVDVVIAAEWMEAGRAIQRGFVTPERTLLIASTHRAYAIAEKSALGDGIADSGAVRVAAEAAARRLLAFDMQRIAEECGTVISAALFGALGASGALPFARSAFESVIRGGGPAAQGSQRAFAVAWARAESAAVAEPARIEALPGLPEHSSLAREIRAAFPPALHGVAWEGVRQLVDYQDLRHARDYLARLAAVLERDRAAGGEAHDYALGASVARHLALWMSYQDAIRVADQKTRASRFREIRIEVRAEAHDLVQPVEFMHPRLEEICDILPRRLGAGILRREGLRASLARFFARGRQVRTRSLGGFLLLYGLAALRPLRRASLRYAIENEQIEAWLGRIFAALPHSYALALEVARCPRLLKGYSDTEARGRRNYLRIMDFVDGAPADDATAQRVRGLHEAALADEEGKALASALAALEAEAVKEISAQSSRSVT